MWAIAVAPASAYFAFPAMQGVTAAVPRGQAFRGGSFVPVPVVPASDAISDQITVSHGSYGVNRFILNAGWYSSRRGDSEDAEGRYRDGLRG